MSGMSFVQEVVRAYSQDGCVGFQIDVLRKTDVPEDWANAIRRVYGSRWDEQVKASGRVLERAYLACMAKEHDLDLSENPLWGAPNPEEDEIFYQRREACKIQIMATKLSATYGQTFGEERNWSISLFYFSAIDRMMAMMGHNVEVCPYCEKAIHSTACECGFPDVDPDDYIKDFVEKMVGLVKERRLIAVSADRQGISWLDNGECRWNDFTKTEEGGILERYSHNGYAVFWYLPETFMRTNTTCGGLVSFPDAVDHNDYYFVKIVWGKRRIFSVECENGEEVYGLGTQSRGVGYFIWLKKDLYYTAFKARMSWDEPEETVTFSLDDRPADLDIYLSPFSLYRETCTYEYGSKLPNDFQWLETESGLRLIHGGVMPRGVPLRVVGGGRDGETIVL